MLSKNPVDVLKEKLDDEEVVEAVRLAVIAELDAINLYLQQARRIQDEKVRSVFLDIAKEEKTHVGEFLAVLEMLDEEQIAELKKGFQEVAELTGYQVKLEPNLESDGNGFEANLEEKVKHFASASRTFRKKLHVVHMPTSRSSEWTDFQQKEFSELLKATSGHLKSLLWSSGWAKWITRR